MKYPEIMKNNAFLVSQYRQKNMKFQKKPIFIERKIKNYFWIRVLYEILI